MTETRTYFDRFKFNDKDYNLMTRWNKQDQILKLTLMNEFSIWSWQGKMKNLLNENQVECSVTKTQMSCRPCARPCLQPAMHRLY